MRDTSGAAPVTGGVVVPPQMEASNDAAATRYAPEAQPVEVVYRTFHQPLVGPPITVTVAPQGIAVTMAPVVPAPARRLSDEAVTRSVAPITGIGGSASGRAAPPSGVRSGVRSERSSTRAASVTVGTSRGATSGALVSRGAATSRGVAASPGIAVSSSPAAHPIESANSVVVTRPRQLRARIAPPYGRTLHRARREGAMRATAPKEYR